MALRYAPNEKFIQGKIYRSPIPDRYPVFNLRYTAGIKGLLGGEYNYHNITGTVDKRFKSNQGKAKETTEHLFLECQETINLYKKFSNKFKLKFEFLKKENFIYGLNINQKRNSQ